MPQIDFTYLSPKNDVYRKKQVSVLNGVDFTVLDVPENQFYSSTSILYLHINRINKRCYIGITIQSARLRWGKVNPYRNNRRFGNAIKKYGWESFDSFIIAFADDRDVLAEAEKQAIAFAGGHKSKFTYNLSPGGDIVSETNKPIVGINLKTGEQKIFKGGAEAARILGFKNPDMPMAVARGSNKVVHDWWFRFADDLKSKPPEIWGERLRIEEVKKRQGKAIVAINLVTHEQRLYRTLAEAGENLGVSQSSVSMVARGEIKSTAGWWFKFEDSNSEPPVIFGFELTRLKRDKKVFAINLETREKREFRNCTVADQELGIYRGACASVCSGARTSAAGWCFSWNETSKAPLKFKGALVVEARSKAIVAIEIDTGQEYLFESAKAAAPILGMSRSAISQVLAGKKKFVKGFMFRFQNENLGHKKSN